MDIASQVDFAYRLVEAAGRLAERPASAGGQGKNTALVRLEKDRDEYHFKSAADKLKAGAQLTLAKFKGKKLTDEEIHVLFRPYLNRVPVYRGIPARLAREQKYQTRRAAFKRIAAKKKEQADAILQKETRKKRTGK